MLKLRRISNDAIRDLAGGLLLVLFGMFFAGFGLQYQLGTLAEMGPGFFPVMVGILLAIIGLSMFVTGLVRAGVQADGGLPFRMPDWRGWCCILAGMLCFVLMGERIGLLPATFCCVFVSALGDRTATLKGSLILAACIAIFGTAVFVYLLQIPLPAFRI